MSVLMSEVTINEEGFITLLVIGGSFPDGMGRTIVSMEVEEGVLIVKTSPPPQQRPAYYIDENLIVKEAKEG